MGDEIELPDMETITIFLTKRFGAVSNVRLRKMDIGKHGLGYRIDYRSRTRNRDERIVLTTLKPSDLGNDYPSDRARSHLLASTCYSDLPGHLRCMDVVTFDGTDLFSVKKSKEIFLVMEDARGKDYFNDFNKIMNRGSLQEDDRRKADKLSTYLTDIHKKKYTGDNSPSLYRRRIREAIGHGSGLMGFLDAISARGHIPWEDAVVIVQKAVSHWDRLKDDHRRLCQVHGDFIPNNIRFQGDDPVLMNRSRGIWGEPAEDVFSLLIYYIFYALIEHGEFRGSFAELFTRIYDRYLNRSWDMDVLKAAPLFSVVKIPYLLNPDFFPTVDGTTRNKLILFSKNVLSEDQFDAKRMDKYLQE